MSSPISKISSLTIGSVESVSPDEIKVSLDVDSPRNTALNTGAPTPFPRINSFVLLPNESGAVVGIVIWLGLEKSAYPKRHGLKDFGLIDLPFPVRKMTVSPIGTLLGGKNKLQLERGIRSFPSVGDLVILPTRDQTIAIVTGQGEDSRVPLGTCPIAHDALITIDPDKLFGRHLAVLGNTGSGKSCTLASLLRSAIGTAQKEVDKAKKDQKHSNARFIVLDPNGEYSKCFQDLGSGCRVFQVPSPGSTDLASANAAAGNASEKNQAKVNVPDVNEGNPNADAKTNTSAGGGTNVKDTEFTLPAWMWNSSEWVAVAQASPRAQKPLLQEALRNLKSNIQLSLSMDKRVFVRCRALRSFLLQFFGKGAISFPANKNCGEQLSRFFEDATAYAKSPNISDDIKIEINEIANKIKIIIDIRTYTKTNGEIGFNDFNDTELARIGKSLQDMFSKFSQDEKDVSTSEDYPMPFDPHDLAEHLETLALQEGGSVSQFISTLTMRIRGLMSDPRMNCVIDPETPLSLKDWLEHHIGSDGGENGQMAVIDMSLVPFDILHLVIAVFSRLVLESLQRYRKLNTENLPTVLVLEEAHTFVAKHLPHDGEIPTPAEMCRGVFERIAREGRKFGLGLVLSSQRPSELSETVLSQCNSFLLHRITNDRDQKLISRLVPDNSRGLLRELPSLPTGHCILMGAVSQVPTLVEIENLKNEHKPQSDDPDFWNVWTNETLRPINWSKIADDWVGDVVTDKSSAESLSGDKSKPS
ncbi:MAG: DUF87 domain-containing protein [Gammaproteobacteria bacterium]|nr:DUF87 domain-containing protein [Gammaproteobacteria bacterium]